MRAKSSLPVTVLKKERNVPRHLAHEPEEEEVVLRGSCSQWHDLTMTCVGLTAPVWVQDSRDERAASPTLAPLLTQDVRLQLQALDLRCPHQSEAARNTGQGLLIDDSQNRISIRGRHGEKGSSVRHISTSLARTVDPSLSYI